MAVDTKKSRNGRKSIVVYGQLPMICGEPLTAGTLRTMFWERCSIAIFLRT